MITIKKLKFITLKMILNDQWNRCFAQVKVDYVDVIYNDDKKTLKLVTLEMIADDDDD